MSAVKPILGVALFLVVMYLIWNLLPPFFHNWQFEDYVETEARDSTYTNQTADDVKALVLKEARNDSIPITAEQINVIKEPNTVSITANYSVHVDLPFFPQDFQFNVSSKNRGF
ncbi:MAG TPA: hypothetical protein VGR50_00865 [Terriglobales bacterium]|nr:hypothetical protein [Terriglobales bacterium]